MIIERQVDCGTLYAEQRRRLISLARSVNDAQLRTVVLATPAWSVADVVAHLVGIAADLNAGEFGSGDGDAWTAKQVHSRRSRSIDELAAEWDQEAPTFEEGLRLLGYEIGSHYVGDLLQHAADIRHALGMETVADNEALVVGLDFYLDSFHQALTTAAVGSVTLKVAGDEWVLGSGTHVASLTANRFELFRCLGGRRSEAQIRHLDWSGDVDRVLAVVSPYALPRADIIES